MTTEQQVIYNSLNVLRWDAMEHGNKGLAWLYFTSQARLLCADIDSAIQEARKSDAI